MNMTPALQRLRQEDREFMTSQGYIDLASQKQRPGASGSHL
jgi:hypothetical protein